MTNKEFLSEQNKHLEIERKFLIEYPDIEWIMSRIGVRKVEITQHYFDTAEERKLRIRTWKENGMTKYILTKKTRISDLVRIEEENEIAKEEYDSYLSTAWKDPEASNLRRISKTRYCIPYEGKTIEVDILPFWDEKALAEIELENENEAALLPPELKIIREVTEERAFTNYNLAEKCQ